MAKFFIDYENVNSVGLEGIVGLTENDTVYIFYSERALTLTFSAHINIMKAKAEIHYIEVTAGGKNSLDFQLSTFLGRCTAVFPNDAFFIISKDAGFDFVRTFWLSREEFSDSKIYCAPTIEKALRFAHIKPRSIPAAENIISEEKKTLKVSTPEFTAVRKDSIPELDGRELLIADEILEKEEIIEEAISPFSGVTKEISAEELKAVDEILAEGEDIPLDIIQFRKDILPVKNESERRPRQKRQPKKDTALKQSKNQKADTEEIQNKISSLIEELSPDENKKKRTYELLKSSNGKQGFYRYLISAFGMEEGGKIYKLIRPEFQNIKNML